jgi:hypothetical protein
VRRTVAASGIALLWLTAAAVPASANDLSDYLGEADRAVYSGQRLVRTPRLGRRSRDGGARQDASDGW